MNDDVLLDARRPGVVGVLRLLPKVVAGGSALPGFWALPLTHCAVVAHVARTHPAGLGFTHKALRETDFHSAAAAMRARDIDAAVRALGFERVLKQRRHGTWTPGFAVERYAELVRERGHAPTSAALMRMGWEGAGLYTAANRGPGGWNDFLAAYAERYPAACAERWARKRACSERLSLPLVVVTPSDDHAAPGGACR